MDLKDLPKIGLVFILIAVILGMGALILNEVKDSAYTETEFSENFTVASGDTNLSTYSPIWSVSVVNGTNFSESFSTPANYNVSLSDGNFTWGVGGIARVTYTYDAENNATNIVDNGTEGISDLSSWLSIIGVVVAAVIIIGLITRGFGTSM